MHLLFRVRHGRNLTSMQSSVRIRGRAAVRPHVSFRLTRSFHFVLNTAVVFREKAPGHAPSIPHRLPKRCCVHGPVQLSVPARTDGAQPGRCPESVVHRVRVLSTGGPEPSCTRLPRCRPSASRESAHNRVVAFHVQNPSPCFTSSYYCVAIKAGWHVLLPGEPSPVSVQM